LNLARFYKHFGQVKRRSHEKCSSEKVSNFTKSRAITQVSDVIWLIIEFGQEFTPMKILYYFGEDTMKTV